MADGAWGVAAVLTTSKDEDVLSAFGIDPDDSGAKFLKKAMQNWGSQASVNNLVSAIEELAADEGLTIPWHIE